MNPNLQFSNKSTLCTIYFLLFSPTNYILYNFRLIKIKFDGTNHKYSICARTHGNCYDRTSFCGSKSPYLTFAFRAKIWGH